MQAYLVVDIGTSSTKVTSFSTSGQQLASLGARYEVSMPQPGWAEQDPEIWWQAVCRLCNELTAAHPDVEVLALVTSGQAPSCVPIDLDGKPLRPAVLWLDRRSTGQVDWLRERLGEERAYAISGNRLDSYFGGLKWLWFRQNEPELFRRTWKILQANSFITYKLTGQAVIDPSQAGLCSPCFDIAQRVWSPEVLRILDIPLEKLPDILPSAAVVGDLTPEAARLTGLKAGLPVVCGGGDFACSCLGAGVTQAGSAAMMLGTAGNLLVPDPPRGDARLLNTVHLTGQNLSLGGVMAGGATQWFTGNVLGLEGSDFYARLESEAAQTPPGADGLIFLPYLMGERTPIWDAQARGVMLGLTSRHTHAHLYRAIMEGVAYAYRQMADVLRASGSRLDYAVAMDGGANSALWRQIFSDILNLPVHWRGGSGGTGLGTAFLAAVAIGVEPHFNAVEKWLGPSQISQPRVENHTIYERLFDIYASLYPRLADDFHVLSNLNNNPGPVQ